MTLLTPSERTILESIRAKGTAGGILDDWAIKKKWAARNGDAVKLTAAGTRILASDDENQDGREGEAGSDKSSSEP